VVRHLSVPPALVPINPIFELLGERRRVQTFRRRLLLEQRAHLVEGYAHVFDKSKDVVQISTLHALDNAAQLADRRRSAPAESPAALAAGSIPDHPGDADAAGHQNAWSVCGVGQ